MKLKGIKLCSAALIATIIFAVPASARTHVMAGVRAAVQEPLHAAILLAFREKNIQAAMARISEADAVSDKTPEEMNAIRIMKGVIAEAAKSEIRPSQP